MAQPALPSALALADGQSKAPHRTSFTKEGAQP